MDLDDKILALFKTRTDEYLSGEEVSASLGVSRQALWKHIEKLRDLGYVIEAVPHLGYKLLEVPDKMLISEIKWNLHTKLMGKEIHFYESVGSTNTIAYELAEKGAPEGTVVIANEQTKGRGRLGRKWVSPEGGIYISCVLRPGILPNEVPRTTLIMAISGVKAVSSFSGLKALIKWPNDLLLSDRKVGGILTELKAETDRVRFVILGIGINVNTPKRTLPEGGTSVKEETRSRKDLSRVELTKALLENMETEYASFTKHGLKPLRDQLKSYSCTLGRRVNVTTSAKKKYHGEAVDIDDNGALVVRMDDGTLEKFLSGDVTLVR